MNELIDNRRRRIEDLKQIIKQLHAGADSNRVRQQFVGIVRSADAGDVAPGHPADTIRRENAKTRAAC